MKKVSEILNLINIQSVSSLIFDWFLVFYANFSNISAISWQPVLVVKETDPGQATGKLYHLRWRVECTLFVIYKSGATHAVLVIGLNKLLGNPITLMPVVFLPDL